MPVGLVTGFTQKASKPGLVVTVNGGTAVISGSVASFPVADISLQPNATNYVYLNFSSGLIETSTSGFLAGAWPICTVVTDTTNVTTLTDMRPDVFGGSGGGSSYTSPGTLFFWNSSGLSITPGLLGGTAVGVGTNKLVYSLYVPFTIKITVLTLRIDSAITANGFVAIYTPDGNTKLLDAGAIANGGVAGVKQVTGLNLTLPPGFYFLYISGDNAGLTMDGGAPASNSEDIMNKTSTRIGLGTNPVVGGVCPATIGAITPSTSLSIPTVLFEN